MRLSVKLASTALGIALAAGFVVSWWFAERTRTDRLAELAALGERVLQSLAGEQRARLNAGDSAGAALDLRRVVEVNPAVLYLYLTDAGGELFAHSFDAGVPVELRQPPAVDGAAGPLPSLVELDGTAVLEVGRPLLPGTAAWIHAGLDTRRVHSEAGLIRGRILAATLVVGLLTAAVALFWSRRFTRSLESLAGQIAAYGRRERFQATPGDGGVAEVREIAHSVEAMVQARSRVESERDRLNSILEAATDFVGTCDPEGRITYINRAGRAMTGIGDRPVTDLNITALHPGWANELLRAVGIPTTLRQGSWVGETALLGPGGAEIPVSQVIVSHCDELGQLSYLSTIMRDISERRDAQRHLEARDALLRRLSERVPGVIYQYRMYPDGRSCMPYASEGIRDIYEVTPEEVREDASPIFARLHPDDVDAVVKSIQRSFADLTTWRLEYRVLLPRGRVRWLLGESLPNRLDDGSVMWHGYISDVTAFRETQESNQRLASIVNYSKDFIGTADLEGKIQFVNRAGIELVGLDGRDGLAGRRVQDFIHESSRDLLDQTVLPALLDRGHWSGEIGFRNFRTGAAIPMLGEAFRIDDAQGRPVTIATVSRDIGERKRVAEALEQSEERLRQAIRASQIGIFDHDHLTDVIYWSPSQRKIHGWGDDEPITLPKFIETVHPDDRAAIAEAVRRAHDPRGDGIYDVQHRIVLPSGEVRWMLTRSQTFFAGEGADRRPARTVGADLDITDRMRVDEALRESEARLAEAQRIGRMGSWVLDLRSSRLEWSEEIFRIFEIDPERFGASYEAFLGRVHPDDRARVAQAYEDSVSDRTPYDIFHRLLMDDGRVKHVREVCETSYDERGEPLRSLGTVQDVTVLREAEEELRKYQQHLEELVAERTRTIRQQALIIDQTHDSVVTTDLEGVVQSWNKGAERMIGYAAAEAIGRHVSFLYSEEDQESLQDRLIEPLRRNGSHDVEVQLVHKSGRPLYVHLSLSLLSDEQGTPSGMVGYSIDITERKAAERALLRRTQELTSVNEELEAFSYSVSHDLRGPLRGIDGFSQALLQDYGDRLDETGRDYLRRVRAGTQRMAELIDDLLSLARLTRARMTPAPVDLAEVAQDVIEQLRRQHPERTVEVSVHPGLSAWGDPGLLRAALDNLIGNAWKYTSKRPDARIEIGRFAQHGEDVHYVRDNGAGFDMRHADRLFGTFQRLHQAHEFEGTGIGLATVQRIVHRHGGRIWAEAEPGKGATFYFTLPGKAEAA